MEDLYYHFGINTGIYLALAVYFGMIRRKEKPFALALGLLMAYSFIVCEVEISLAIHHGIRIPQTIMAGLDYGVIPLFLLEMMCLINQDLEAFTWGERLKKTGYFTIPIILYLAYCYVNEEENVYATIPLLFLTLYPIVIFAHIAYKLRNFQHMLREAGGEQQSISWAWTILLVLFLEYTLYLVYPGIPNPSIYYTAEAILLLMHAYFVDMQVPTDTTKLREEMQRKEEERLKEEGERLKEEEEWLKKEQEKTLEELKDVTETLKKKAQMETTILEYKTLRPGFESRLRALTENKLTQRDIYLCIMICKGMRTNEMAEELAISPSSVEIARHRLRSKLGLEKGANLKNMLEEVQESGGG